MSDPQPTVALVHGAFAESLTPFSRSVAVSMDTPRHSLPDAEQRVVEVLVDEHVHVSCDLIPIDDETWAIRGSIAVDGEVIVAEFHDRADAESALELLSAAEDRTTG